MVGMGRATVMVNAASEADPVALVAVMVMLLKVPAVVGVPVNAPVALLKINPAGIVPA